MLDLLYFLVTAVIFLACWGLMVVCQRLMEE